ncbi:MAG: hypothetical protein A2Y75_05255 [Candidatus Solincola sediminis]|uniref:Uncharacterized protein n=1 Tax=Candidatus Solincola sediminis TaxID=1797199 RepID=A0A1F2WG58_9ACTN|nr:MAG: hypothetical protein A2Y75_05255 [Candidatus Solincola sediminis]
MSNEETVALETPEAVEVTDTDASNTDVSADSVDGADDAAATEDSKTKVKDSAGRTRPSATIERDLVVLETLTALVNGEFKYGVSRNELAAELGMEPPQVYLCLYRLNRDGNIKRASSGARARWAPIEYEVPARPAPVIDENATEQPAAVDAPSVPEV